MNADGRGLLTRPVWNGWLKLAAKISADNLSLGCLVLRSTAVFLLCLDPSSTSVLRGGGLGLPSEELLPMVSSSEEVLQYTSM